MVTRTRRLIVAGMACAAIAAALIAYFVNDSRAREKKGGPRTPAVPVSVSPALQQSVPVRLRAIGNVEAFSTVSLKARVDGQIMTVNFREGQEVKKGETLFRIDPRPFEAALRQAEANALRDAAARDQARSQERRYKDLLEKNFVSGEAYAQIATNAQTAEATAKASQAALENSRLNLEFCTIASPIDGFVGRILLQVGNLAKANDVNPLAVINQVRPIYVNFAVPEHALPEVRRYMAAGPLAVEALASGAEQPLAEGRLVFVDNAVDPSTGTIRLRAQFDNREAALWPGQFVNVRLRLYEQADAIVVPARAVQTGPDGQFVYVVRPDMTAELRKVTVERADGEQAILAKGVAQGERVVTQGQLRLGPNTRVQIGKPAAGTL
ncbi:MAG: efflux RND transporter periplasmic adaptor subunit [Burkholderiales bacterium]